VAHVIRTTRDPDAFLAELRQTGLRDEAERWEVIINQPLSPEFNTDSWLFPEDAAYPPSWEDRLGDAAPPSVQTSGPVPALAWLGIVGVREASDADQAWAFRLGEAAVRLGYGVISGGARGVDRAAVAGALEAGGNALELLATGLPGIGSHPPELVRASALPHGAEFTTAMAWRRNAWIYGAAEAVVVVRAQMGRGGSWGAARDGLRRHWAPLIVRGDPDDDASRAIAAQGAVPLADAEGLAGAIEESKRRFNLRAPGTLFSLPRS